MNPSHLGKTLACILLCGCASVPPVGSTDEADQTVLHVDGSPIPLKALTFERRQHELERNNLQQRIMELSNEISNLKGKQWSPAPTPPQATAAFVDPAPVMPVKDRAGKNKASATAQSTAMRINRETIVIQENSMVFQVMHDFAKTEFNPSKGLQRQLLQAARAGKRIDIRGRTDARVANEADRDIAMQRALNARLFLANNGIHPRKMHLNVLAAGDNVADNATADGRSRNRRVEIETAGIKPEVLENLASVIRQDLQ